MLYHRKVYVGKEKDKRSWTKKKFLIPLKATANGKG
jgi:hypothetical protein